MKLASITIFAALMLGTIAQAQDFVPFVIPMTPNEKSLITLASPPIPTGGQPMTVRDGHFFVGDKRFRVWGVNLCFGASFPTHADAERLAARLAAGGVNSVRFHHMDTSAWPNGILDPKDLSKLHPEAVERLDYLINELAKRGIYANVNLHVGAKASKWLGLPDPGTDYDKIVDLFTPEIFEAQKKYARDLLGHENPYRKMRPADDPAVGFVEITNEDSFFMWDGPQRLPGLPEFYAKILRGKYIEWLKKEYGSADKLREAWAKGAEPLGDSLITDPDFKVAAADAKTPHWDLEQHAPAAAKATPLADMPHAVRLEVSKVSGTDWHLQFRFNPIRVESGRYYTLTFRARADQPRQLAYGVGMNHEPWQTLGLWGGAALTKEWKTFSAGFLATATDDVARLSFTIGNAAGALEIADVVLAPGGREGLRKGESLEEGSVALFSQGGETLARGTDRIRFLADTEKAYFDGMRTFLKKDLGLKALVTGTIVFGPAGLWAQSGMDYIDGHSYWRHPSFPGRAWDMSNWIVDQSAMVDHPGGTLPALAAQRVAGKPYTVSEYLHPAPNDYQAECVPEIASFAAAQDWDGIWLFAYSHRGGPIDSDHFTSFFDIDANPAKWGFMPAGAVIFRDGGIAPLAAETLISVKGADGPEKELARLALARGNDMWGAIQAVNGVKWEDLMQARLAVTLAGQTGATQGDGNHGFGIRWQKTPEGKGSFTAQGKAGNVCVGHPPQDGWGRLEVESPAFAVVATAPLDGKPGTQSERILLTACGRCENTDMQFSADRRTVGTNWGKGPVRIEAVKGSLPLPPGKWKCQALAPDGTASAEVKLEYDAPGGCQILKLSPEYKTMWYLLTPAK